MTPATLHPGLAGGRWRELSLPEQLGNVGSELSRALKRQGRDAVLFEKAMTRALDLLDLTLGDPRWRTRLRELARLREILCGAWLEGSCFGTTLADLDAYLTRFALAARAPRGV